MFEAVREIEEPLGVGLNDEIEVLVKVGLVGEDDSGIEDLPTMLVRWLLKAPAFDTFVWSSGVSYVRASDTLARRHLASRGAATSSAAEPARRMKSGPQPR